MHWIGGWVEHELDLLAPEGRFHIDTSGATVCDPRVMLEAMLCAWFHLPTRGMMRISAIVDAGFGVIADGVSA